jgi:hypothetical protein
VNTAQINNIDLILLIQTSDKLEAHQLTIDGTVFIDTTTAAPSNTTTAAPTTAAPTQAPTPAPTVSCFNISSSDPLVCYHHGICVGHNRCQCFKHYNGTQCEFTTCFGVAHKSVDVCSGQGVCTDFNTCACKGDYIGYDCSVQNTSRGLYIVVITMTVFSGFCVLFLLAVISYLFYRRPSSSSTAYYQDEDSPSFGTHRLHDEDEDEDNLLEMEERGSATNTPTVQTNRETRSNEGRSYSLNDDSDEDLDIRV